MNFDKIITEVCEKKSIRESQFKDYLTAYGKFMIEREAERFIDYCEADGWHYWNKNIELPGENKDDK